MQNCEFKVNYHNQFCLIEHPPEAEVPIEPPSATTTTTIGISATSVTFTSAFSKKRASVATTPGTNRKNKKNKTKDSSPSEPIILQDPQVSFVFPCIIMSFVELISLKYLCLFCQGCVSTTQGWQEQDPWWATGWGWGCDGWKQRFRPLG